MFGNPSKPVRTPSFYSPFYLHRVGSLCNYRISRNVDVDSGPTRVPVRATTHRSGGSLSFPHRMPVLMSIYRLTSPSSNGTRLPSSQFSKKFKLPI